MANGGHLKSIDCLRGLAALAVCFCHVAAAHPGPLQRPADAGALGVIVFFAISGFVIPYALHNRGYRVAGYGRFLAKRMIRLDPPYLVSLAMAIGMAYISSMFPQFRGGPPNFTLAQVLLHLGYLNSFFGGNWILGTYWTLGIEFQYYVLLGLLFPVIASRRTWVRGCVVGAIACAAYVTAPANGHQWQATVYWGPYLPIYGLVFAMGILTFQHRAGMLAGSSYLAWLATAAGLCAMVNGPAIAMVALSTALTIAFVAFESRIFEWLGMISYSLYLFHPLAAGRVEGVGFRLVSGTGPDLVVILAALLAAVALAYVMYRVVEVPSLRWAGRIGYARESDVR